MTVSFRHYGVYDVEVRKEGFETLRSREPVLAPPWARFPLCLFTELLWPGVIHDDRYLSYELAPPVTPAAGELLRRAAEAEKSAKGAAKPAEPGENK